MPRIRTSSHPLPSGKIHGSDGSTGEKQRSVYGPVWMGAMALVVAAAGGSVLRAMLLAKWLAAGLGGLAAAAIVRLGSTGGPMTEASWRPMAVLAAFALNPLVLSAVPLSGHADAAVAAALVWAVVCDRRRRTTLSALLLCGAALVKAYAGLVLIAYLLAVRRRDGSPTAARAAAAAVALGVISFVPYWDGFGTFGALATLAGRASASLSGDVITIATRALAVLDVREAGEVAAAAVRVARAALVIGTLAFVAVGHRRPRPLARCARCDVRVSAGGYVVSSVALGRSSGFGMRLARVRAGGSVRGLQRLEPRIRPCTGCARSARDLGRPLRVTGGGLCAWSLKPGPDPR